MRGPSPSMRLVVVVGWCVVVAAGCVSAPDSGEAPSTTAGRSETSTSAAPSSVPDSTTSTSRPTGPTVEVTLADHRFEGLPAEIEAGTQIDVFNSSKTDLHEFVALRIPDDETRSVEELVALGDGLLPALGRSVPDVVRVARPGEKAIEGAGDPVFDEPGRYLVIDNLPAGSAPEVIESSEYYISGQVPEQYADAQRHWELGMVDQVIVT